MMQSDYSLLPPSCTPSHPYGHLPSLPVFLQEPHFLSWSTLPAGATYMRVRLELLMAAWWGQKWIHSWRQWFLFSFSQSVAKRSSVKVGPRWVHPPSMADCGRAHSCSKPEPDATSSWLPKLEFVIPSFCFFSFFISTLNLRQGLAMWPRLVLN